jgi:hypothetical protein
MWELTTWDCMKLEALTMYEAVPPCASGLQCNITPSIGGGMWSRIRSSKLSDMPKRLLSDEGNWICGSASVVPLLLLLPCTQLLTLPYRQIIFLWTNDLPCHLNRPHILPPTPLASLLSTVLLIMLSYVCSYNYTYLKISWCWYLTAGVPQA